MSLAVPPALKAADIARFAHRAGQLETARPAVAYWCNYWMVEQIIAKGLHQADDDSKAYTIRLMDKLEQTKVDFADNNAITDDMAGHAFIEQFGQETFQRADNAMKANKVTRQTADTFQAAGTFLELCQIWGSLDAEIASKIKFAKYHALRIAKAIKAGEDPNDSNPTIETTENGDDAEPGTLGDPASQLQSGATSSRQPFVEELSDQPQAVDMSSPAAAPSGSVENYYQAPPPADVSPLAPSDQESKSPENDGYFSGANEKTISNGVSPVEPTPFVNAPRPALSPDPQFAQSGDLSTSHRPVVSAPESVTPEFVPPGPPSISSKSVADKSTPSYPPVAPPAAPVPTPANAFTSRPDTTAYKDDEVSVVAAQKHARFAISALNFEDVPTAVKELRAALVTLGVKA